VDGGLEFELTATGTDIFSASGMLEVQNKNTGAVTYTADLCLTPDGRFLYGSNRGHDTIAAYAVDETTGALTCIGIVPGGGPTPQNLTMSPDGKLLFVCNNASDKVSSFRIDGESGALTLGSETEVPSPVCSVLA